MRQHVLWSAALRPVDHRLLWWLLAHQAYTKSRGKLIPTGVVHSGWRKAAEEELGVSDVAIWKAQTRLKRAGIIEARLYARTLTIRGEVFEQAIPA